MNIPPVKALLLFYSLSVFPSYQEQTPRSKYPVDDSLAITKMRNLHQYLLNIRSPELARRKEERRVLQRQGYARMLMDVLNDDGLSALLSYVKVKLQLDFVLSNQPPIYLMRGDPKFGIQELVIPEDWSFPADPWNRE